MAWAQAPAASRLPALIGPALAQALAGDAAGVDPQAARADRLAARFRLARQRECLALIADTGVETVALKGFVTARWLYAEPELRCSGDLDVLVRAADLSRVLVALGDAGYRFRPLPAKPWGFLSRASFQPYVSADGAVNLDLHVQPDCWPLERGLDAEAVFAEAVALEAGSPVLAPAPSHLFLLLASNAAKDKFGPFATKKLLDAHRWLSCGGPEIESEALARLAAAAGLARPLGVFLALLADLGVDEARLPGRPLRAPRGPYDRLLADWQALFPAPPGPLAGLARELRLSAEPRVAATLAWRRLSGLVRRPSGLPEGWR